MNPKLSPESPQPGPNFACGARESGLKPEGREALEGAGLFVKLVLVQIVPDIVDFQMLTREPAHKAVLVEGRGKDAQRGSVPGPGRLVVLLSGHIGSQRAAALGEYEGRKEAIIGGAPGAERSIRYGGRGRQSGHGQAACGENHCKDFHEITHRLFFPAPGYLTRDAGRCRVKRDLAFARQHIDKTARPLASREM